MAEGQQPAVAEQEVEGAGEEREAEHLHQEDRVEHERRDHEQREQRREDRQVVAGHAERGGLQRQRDVGGGAVAHHAALPKRPAGLTRSTSAMITKITTAEPSG